MWWRRKYKKYMDWELGEIAKIRAEELRSAVMMDATYAIKLIERDLRKLSKELELRRKALRKLW